MKTKLAFIAFVLILSIFSLSACDLAAGILGSGTSPDMGENQGTQDEENPNLTPDDGGNSEANPDSGNPDSGNPDGGNPDSGESDPHVHDFVDGKCACGETDPEYKPEEPEVLNPTTVYLVGDSTVCSFADGYYYPRYGYGTQLANYLSDEASVVNLALSGRSSKSFITEQNYQTLKNSLKEGDYLIIGFGHNDEKSDDSARFTDASKPYTDSTSFGYYLNTYYVQLALECGATPILCTPIVRAASDNGYNDSEAHVTATGDYAQAIRDLGAALGVAVVDLTAITKAEYSKIGFEQAKYYHAVTVGKLDSDGVTVVPNFDSVDKTHLNIYGAKFVAYSLAKALVGTSPLGKYLLEDATAPTIADLTVNPGYVYSNYASPDLGAYKAPDHLSVMTDGWYGTAFGDTGGDPASASNGYFATETSTGVYKVGQTAGSSKGKFSSTADGFAFLFKQVSAESNFKISVTATITTTASTKQMGFGLMLRDDAYLPVKDASIVSNYLTAGILCEADSTTALFLRENSALTKGQSFASSLPKVGDVFNFTVERVGQSVYVSVTQGDKTVSTTHYDFDLFAKDGDYMYVGMFANRGTVVEFTDLVFEITGTSQGA